MIKKNLRLGLAGIVLVGSVFLRQNENKHRLVPEEQVAVGESKYHEGILKSDGFIECTGIIIDNGNGAIMIHAMPTEYEKTFGNHFFEYTSRGGKPIMVRDINYAIKELAESKKLDLKNSRTIALIEESQNLEEVRSELRDAGLSIDEVIRYSKKDSKEKSIIYNTFTNKVRVR